MRSYEEQIKIRNSKIEKEYANSLENVKTIWESLKDKTELLDEYLFSISDKILYFSEMEKDFDESYYLKSSNEILEKTNLEMHEELFPENYNESYANPDHCVKLFGKDWGTALSKFYTEFRNFQSFSFQHIRFELFR